MGWTGIDMGEIGWNGPKWDRMGQNRMALWPYYSFDCVLFDQSSIILRSKLLDSIKLYIHSSYVVTIYKYTLIKLHNAFPNTLGACIDISY